MQFNIVVVVVVVAHDKSYRPGWRRFAAQPPQPTPGALFLGWVQHICDVLPDMGHGGSTYGNGVILLGFRAKISKVIGAEVDAAYECDCFIDDNDLAMHAVYQVGSETQETGLRV